MSQAASAICSTARSIAKCPQFLSQSGQALNEVLADVCETQDFDLARGLFAFNFNTNLNSPTAVQGSGPYPLPADWLRADFGDVFFVDNGVPHPLTSIDLYQWDHQVQQAGLQSYPSMYTTDLSLQLSAVPVMYVYSPPQSNFICYARYRRQMPDILTPESSGVPPWFPYTQYLIEATATRLMSITDDERWDAFEKQRLSTMNRILKMANDNSGRAKTVKLDPRRFGVDRNLLPNTKSVWI